MQILGAGYAGLDKLNSTQVCNAAWSRGSKKNEIHTGGQKKILSLGPGPYLPSRDIEGHVIAK